MNTPDPAARFSTLLQQFFVDYLIGQRNVSPRTVASYRDTFRLFLHFVEEHVGRPPHKLRLTDFDAGLILDFLNHLEVVDTTRSVAVTHALPRSGLSRTMQYCRNLPPCPSFSVCWPSP